MVHHVGVGDGQYHTGVVAARWLSGRSEPAIEPVLQIDHIRRAVHRHLGIHSMVCRERYHAAQRFQLAQVAVHHGVEVVRAARAGRELVLDVVGGGEVHYIGPVLVHQLHAGRENKLGQVRAVDAGHGFADQAEHIGDAIDLLRNLVRLFGREADAAHLVAQQRPQFVLGRDHGDRLAGVGQRGQKGRRAQPFGVVHHHLGAAGGVEQVVAADAMHAGWHAGHDGQVVGVGEAGYHAFRDQTGAVGQGLFEPGHMAGRDGLGQIIGLATVHANHHGWLRWQLVAALVHVQHGRFLSCQAVDGPPSARG